MQALCHLEGKVGTVVGWDRGVVANETKHANAAVAGLINCLLLAAGRVTRPLACNRMRLRGSGTAEQTDHLQGTDRRASKLAPDERAPGSPSYI